MGCNLSVVSGFADDEHEVLHEFCLLCDRDAVRLVCEKPCLRIVHIWGSCASFPECAEIVVEKKKQKSIIVSCQVEVRRCR